MHCTFNYGNAAFYLLTAPPARTLPHLGQQSRWKSLFQFALPALIEDAARPHSLQWHLLRFSPTSAVRIHFKFKHIFIIYYSKNKKRNCTVQIGQLVNWTIYSHSKHKICTRLGAAIIFLDHVKIIILPESEPKFDKGWLRHKHASLGSGMSIMQIRFSLLWLANV